MDNIAVIADSRDAIAGLLGKLNVVVPTFKRDPSLEQRVDQIMESWNFQLPRAHVISGITIAITAYNHIRDFNTRVYIAVYSAIVIAMDSPDVLEALAFDSFHERLSQGHMQQDTGLLGELARYISASWQYYPRFAASCIMTSSLEFVNICILENTFPDLTMHSGALSFIEYRRGRTGVAEAFAYFIWDKAQFPDETEYVQAIPDVLSFYKEALSGESGTCLQDRSLLSGKSHLQTLYDVIDDTIAASERVRAILGNGQARDAWEAFMIGYLSFHMSAPRYRLFEIVDTKYIVA
ncbi:terpene cyclase [Gelatoporia subvermispora B]|uniref:Terpene cyclase n=1 Tax=Ceriporiopsis subvermispora (strain B) TaxID=914234 RepID=M2P859_CERS8|nr:terpene cyclase [Gelatoporia subvermispora B]